MTIRPYTGLKDSVHAKPRAGTKLFVEYCEYLFGVKCLGIFADRNINGSGMPKPPKSVHSTWRAFDLGGTVKQRYNLIDFLWVHRDILGVEEIHDYANTYKPSSQGPSKIVLKAWATMSGWSAKSGLISTWTH